MNRTKCLAFLVVASFALTYAVSAQTTRSSPENPKERGTPEIDEKPIEIAAAANIYRVNETIRAEFSLGVLEAGRKYRLKLAAVNPLNDTIAFARAQVGCTCMSFEADAKEILANGTAVFVVTFMTNESASNRTNIESIRLMNTGVEVPVGIFVLNYELSNFFDIKSDRIVIEIPEEENSVEVRVPVHIEPPLTREKLELIVSRQLRDLAVELLPDGEHAIIKVTANKQNINLGSIAGDISLKRQDSKHQDGFALLVRRQEKLTINPESIRLERVPNKDNVYMGRAILRSKMGNTNGDAPQVDLQVAGKTARVEAKPIGSSGIYRVDIRVDGPLEPGTDGKLAVKWSIRFGIVERVIDSYGFLE